MTDKLQSAAHARKSNDGEATPPVQADISGTGASAPYLDSSPLATFRELIAAFPVLRGLGGDMLQYTVIIDANIAVGDLLYKYRNPHMRQTAIEEAIASSALRVHAPRWLDAEMTTSAIPQVSRAKGLPEAELLSLWVAYREVLIWNESLTTSGADDGPSDPKDAPYVVLEDVVAAVGVLTRDKDIEGLGGRMLTLDFVFSVRDYARAKAYCVGIRIGGTMVGYITMSALIQGIRGLTTLVSKLPPWAKITILLTVAIVALHPQLRPRVLSFLEDACSATKIILPELQKLIVLMQEKQLEADAAHVNAALLMRG